MTKTVEHIIIDHNALNAFPCSLDAFEVEIEFEQRTFGEWNLFFIFLFFPLFRIFIQFALSTDRVKHWRNRQPSH